MNKKIATAKKVGIMHWLFGGFIFPVIIVGITVILGIIVYGDPATNPQFDIFLNTTLGMVITTALGLGALALSTYVSSLIMNKWYIVTDVKRVATISAVVMLTLDIIGTVLSDSEYALGVDIVVQCIHAAIFYGLSVLWIKNNANEINTEVVTGETVQNPTV